MAACKDCGTQISFMAKRCDACKVKFDAMQAERNARDAEERQKAAAQQWLDREAAALKSAVSALDVTHDRMENKRQAFTPRYRSLNGIASVRFAVVNDTYYWMIATQRKPDWDWLENNRTIILFPDESRFVQDHGSLNESDVQTDTWNNVVCYEELHVNITDAVPYFVDTYSNAVAQGRETYIPIRIGRTDAHLLFESIRDVVSLHRLVNG